MMINAPSIRCKEVNETRGGWCQNYAVYRFAVGEDERPLCRVHARMWKRRGVTVTPVALPGGKLLPGAVNGSR